MCFTEQEKAELLETTRTNEKDLIRIKATYHSSVAILGVFMLLFGWRIESTMRKFEASVEMSQSNSMNADFLGRELASLSNEMQTMRIPDNTDRVDRLREEQIEQNKQLGEIHSSLRILEDTVKRLETQ